MENQKKCNYWRCANSVGLFLTILFTICFLWYYIRPVEQEMHLALFRMVYLGFDGMDALSFIFGAVQTYLWAYVAIGAWNLVGCCRKNK